MKAFRFIKEFFTRFPLLTIWTTFLLACVGVCGASAILIFGPLVDFFLETEPSKVGPLTSKAMSLLDSVGLPVTLNSWVLVLFIFILLTSFFQVLSRYFMLKIKYKVIKSILMGTFDDFFGANWYFFSKHKQGAFLNTFSRELQIVGNAFTAIALFFSWGIQMIFYVAVPFYISWQVTLMSFAVALLTVVPFLYLDKLSYRWGQIGTRSSNELTRHIQESLALVKVILGFGNQNKSRDKVEDAWDMHASAVIKAQIIKNSIPAIYRPFAVVIIIAALYSTRWFGVPVSEITVLLLGLFQVATCISNIAMQKNALVNFFPSYEQIKSLRNQAIELRQASGKEPFTGFKEALHLENLSFSYPEHDEVLTNIDMTIKKGQMVAFVGKSGAGKSTLIDLIMGFYEPTKGKIRFNGNELKDFDIVSYRNNIGYVPQDSVLFNMSIKDNLLWANTQASDQDIENACVQAYAHEFIKVLPDGYNTIVGDRGVRLSGGQKQRISLARALLRNPELLILDEATSALDSESEKCIQQAIENIAQKSTIIVIAHRLSTIKKADCIFVLEDGKVVESGAYDELIENDKDFNNMAQLQKLQVST